MPETQPQTQPGAQQPIAAFVLSLIAGLWMLAAGGMMSGFGMMGGFAGSPGAGYGMHGWGGMQGWVWGSGMYGAGLGRSWFGAVAGILVIIGAIILYVRPERRRGWGVVILVASALDFLFGMGGLVAGMLGIIGGVLAISA